MLCQTKYSLTMNPTYSFGEDCAMKSIIYLNNQGIRHYENCHFDKAKEFLRSAVVELNTLREHCQHTMHDEQLCEKQFLSQHGTPIEGWSQPFRDPMQDDYAIMFTRAMFLKEFDCDHHFDDESRLFHLNVATIVLLYNTSLLNHVFSDSNGQISAVADAAYHGYEEAFVISRTMDKCSTNFSFQLQVLTLALFNNMGVLYYNNMCRFRDAAQCFRASRKQMNILGERLLQQEIMTAKEVQQLSTNLLTVPYATTPAA
mmetsp:Transcript_15108/g.23201  ORF Transcript_15108/g.23201 Transcript_15108/m.23201 type:complete len:258 (+) Transcript_15108:128-901(+)